LGSRNASIPYGPYSRPTPENLKPPQGACGSSVMLLISTRPARICDATRRARSRSVADATHHLRLEPAEFQRSHLIDESVHFAIVIEIDVVDGKALCDGHASRWDVSKGYCYSNFSGNLVAPSAIELMVRPLIFGVHRSGDTLVVVTLITSLRWLPKRRH
jgi:hypothetical protein